MFSTAFIRRRYHDFKQHSNIKIEHEPVQKIHNSMYLIRISLLLQLKFVHNTLQTELYIACNTCSAQDTY